MENLLVGELKEVVLHLQKNEYATFFEGKYRSRVAVGDFLRVLEEYGGVVTTPPIDSYMKANVIKLKSGSGYVVEFNLWIDGKESDLSIVLEIGIQSDDQVQYVEISDLLVM